MNTFRRLLTLAAIVACLGASSLGASAHDQDHGRGNGNGYGHGQGHDGPHFAPPRGHWERHGPPPGRGYVWVGGYERWYNGAYVWVPGNWQRPPHYGYHWYPGYWTPRSGIYIWISGHWSL